MAAQEPQLELGRELLRDLARDEAAEAGVDAVGVVAVAVRDVLDERAGRPHPLARGVGDRGGSPLTATSQTSATVSVSPVRPIAVRWATR